MLVCSSLPGKPDFRVLDDLATVVRLGQGVDQNRRFHPDAMERTLACLKRYSARLRELGGDPSKTIAVATSGSRDASNSADFFALVEQETGFRFRRISGDDEARFTHLGGVLEGMDPQTTAVIDIGGGSTELKTASGGMSVDIGSVRFTERYLKSDPVTDEEFWKCQEAVDSAIHESGLLKWRSSIARDTRLCAVAGTATTLAAWFLGLEKFNAAKIDGLTLSRGDIHRQVEDLKWRTVAERRAQPGIEEGRADVLLAGALILWRSMELLGFPEVTISTRGLRYGVLKLVEGH
jgi:exopolyphosphatase/guanosine-5'-triphosphate,3'-diphosphate pyrophosphatase